MPENAPRHSIAQRLEEFYRRLRLLPRASTAETALAQLCTTLERVEDELSGIPKKSRPPLPTRSGGRMYCPLEDYIHRRPDGSILALTRGHRIEIDEDGRVRIVHKVTLQVEFEK